MLTRDFDYDLPEGAIADRPAPRGESRLLAVDREAPERHRRVRDLPALLRPGDLVIVNDTRVIPARLLGWRRGEGGERGGGIELLLVERRAAREWEALGKPGRRLRAGACLEFETGLEAEVVEVMAGGGRYRIRFSAEVEPHLERIGHVPLPPYIKRPDDPDDCERYQTVFAKHPGAIAAPTAGLHLSAEILAGLAAAAIEVAYLTLHVGIGTFKPVTAELVHEHRMDAERYVVPEAAAEAWRRARARGERVDRALHHPRLPLPGGRPAAHELPPAPLDAPDARLGLHGPGAGARGLQRGDRGGLPLLLLRGRDAGGAAGVATLHAPG